LANFHFEKINSAWDLRNKYEILWEYLIKENPSIENFITENSLESTLPISDELNNYTDKDSLRPSGSRRAFYIRLKPKGVLAIKGTEIFHPNLKNELVLDAKKKLVHRPWTKFENFIYREQKVPLAILYNEALEENILAANFQSKILDRFGSLELAPTPLFVYKFSKKIKYDYYKLISSFYSNRALNICKPFIDNYGLGASIYYYPELPYRIRFCLPTKNDSYQIRNLNIAQNGELMSFDPYNASRKLIKITAKMLAVGFMPFSNQDYGIGQCIAPQNVTLSGGIADMGSLHDINEISSEKEFYELFLSMIVMLTNTIKELMIKPKNDMHYEFEEPSLISSLLIKFIWDKLLKDLYEFSKKDNISFDPKLKKFLSDDIDLNINNIISKIY
tara:strand:+ start:3230 stop:4399 length:1170 start_codon:yes stop_codon:yes gene_type:complete